MTPILDRFLPATTAFQPTTLEELFGLRLAHKLDDAQAFRHYVSLTDSHPQGQLLWAYRRAKRAGGHADLGRRFQVELDRTHSNGYCSTDTNQISIRIERRTVAVAIFHGSHLEYSDSRQLSSVRDKALSSAVGFIDW